MEPRKDQDAFREAARRKLAAVAGASVELYADVHYMADGGAFVEAQLWIAEADVPAAPEPVTEPSRDA